MGLICTCNQVPFRYTQKLTIEYAPAINVYPTPVLQNITHNILLC